MISLKGEILPLVGLKEASEYSSSFPDGCQSYGVTLELCEKSATGADLLDHCLTA